MEIEITKTKTEKVNVQLPFYCKSKTSLYKVIDKDHCIQVSNLVNHCIQKAHAGLAFCMDYSECTPEEFETAFNEVSEKLKSVAL